MNGRAWSILVTLIAVVAGAVIALVYVDWFALGTDPPKSPGWLASLLRSYSVEGTMPVSTKYAVWLCALLFTSSQSMLVLKTGKWILLGLASILAPSIVAMCVQLEIQRLDPYYEAQLAYLNSLGTGALALSCLWAVGATAGAVIRRLSVRVR